MYDIYADETHTQRLARQELQLLHGHSIPHGLTSNPAFLREAEQDVIVDTNIVDHPGDSLDLLVEGATPHVPDAEHSIHSTHEEPQTAADHEVEPMHAEGFAARILREREGKTQHPHHVVPTTVA